MKKSILLLCVFALIFTACETDEETQDSEPFIGIWEYSQYFRNDVEQVLDSCDTDNLLTVSADGTYVFTGYETSESGKCEDYGDDTGQWTTSNSNYVLTGSDGETETLSIVFGNDTFTILESGAEGTGDDRVEYTDRKVYTRQ